MEHANGLLFADIEPVFRDVSALREQRGYSRVKLALPGRYLGPDGVERACATVDVAAGGVRVRAKRAPAPGSRVVVYVQELGRIEGVVVRTMSDGFAFVVSGTQRKSDRLVEKINWILRRKDMSVVERRLLPRLELNGAIVVSLRHDGMEETVDLLDISAAGVAFRTELALKIGQSVHVGARPARIERLFEGGAAAQFT